MDQDSRFTTTDSVRDLLQKPEVGIEEELYGTPRSTFGSGLIRWEDFDSSMISRTDIDLEVKEDISQDVKEEFSSSKPLKTVSFSDKYMQYRTAELIALILEKLKLWADVGTEDGLIYITEIRSSLQEYAKFLDFRAENRVFVGTLQLLMQGDRWESYTQDDLYKIIRELERFSSGEVNVRNTAFFNKQLLSFGISFFG